MCGLNTFQVLQSIETEEQWIYIGTGWVCLRLGGHSSGSGTDDENEEEDAEVRK